MNIIVVHNKCWFLYNAVTAETGLTFTFRIIKF